uniref:Uncharacterized protein n=1 Tax=Oryza barthii TaxID=65489 RepID=A0A0D3FKD4_9ORYZ
MSAKLPQVQKAGATQSARSYHGKLFPVNRLLPSAHFHGQCSKLYIRTYCKARSAAVNRCNEDKFVWPMLNSLDIFSIEILFV